MKCHLWGKCETEPDVHYEGGELRVFDHVEVTGISLFEMDRMLESQVGAIGDKKYHILIEEHGFRLLEHDRELHAYCVDQFEYGRVVELYIEVSFSELLASQWGSDIDDEDFVLEDEYDESDSQYTLGSDSGEFSGKDSDYEQNSDDNDYEENVDHNLEWLGVENHRKEQLKRNEKKECVEETRGQTVSNSDTDDHNSDMDVAPDSGSDIDSLQGSDEEGHCRPFMYDPKHADNPNLEIRQVFTTFKEFKEAVRTWNIKRGRPFKFIKSDTIRCRAICPKKGCDWCIYARKMKGDGRLEVRTFQQKHKCGFSYHNKSVKSGWVGRKYVNIFRENPKMDYASFKNLVMKENKCYLSRHQGYRAKKIGRELGQVVMWTGTISCTNISMKS